MNTQKQLLIIDDDPDYVEGIKSILEKAEYFVDVAYNPKDGFQNLKAKNYDLLLLDIDYYLLLHEPAGPRIEEPPEPAQSTP